VSDQVQVVRAVTTQRVATRSETKAAVKRAKKSNADRSKAEFVAMLTLAQASRGAEGNPSRSAS